MKQIKNKKSILSAAGFVIGLVVMLSMIYFTGSKMAMGSIEAHAEKASKKTLEKRSDLEKDIVSESDSFLQTSKLFAQELLEKHADLPLLDEYADEHWGNSSLENIMNDMNAGDGAKVYLDEKELFVTKREFELLKILISNKNITMTREQLLNSAWGWDYEGNERTVDVHIQRLRKKLNWESYIKTMYKTGYRLET